MNSRPIALALALLVFATASASAADESVASTESSRGELADPTTWGLYAYMLGTEWKAPIKKVWTVKWGNGQQLVLHEKALVGETTLLIEPKAPGELKLTPKGEVTNVWTGKIGDDNSVTWTHDKGFGVPFRHTLRGKVFITESVQIKDGVVRSAGGVVKMKGEPAPVASGPKHKSQPIDVGQPEAAFATTDDPVAPSVDQAASTVESASDDMPQDEVPADSRKSVADVLAHMAGDAWRLHSPSDAEPTTWWFDWIDQDALLRADAMQGHYLYTVASDEIVRTFQPDDGAPLTENWRRNPDGSISTVRWEQSTNLSAVETHRIVAPDVVHVYRSTLRADGSASRERLMQWYTRADAQNVPVVGSEHQLKEPEKWGPLAALANRAALFNGWTHFFKVSATGDAMYELIVNPEGTPVQAILKITPDGHVMRFLPNAAYGGHYIAQFESGAINWKDVDPRSRDLASSYWNWRFSLDEASDAIVLAQHYIIGASDLDDQPNSKAGFRRNVRFAKEEIDASVTKADALSATMFERLHALELKAAARRRKQQQQYADNGSWARTLYQAMEAEHAVQQARTQRTLDNLNATLAEAERRARLEREGQALRSTTAMTGGVSSVPSTQQPSVGAGPGHTTQVNAPSNSPGFTQHEGSAGTALSQSNAHCTAHPIRPLAPAGRSTSREQAESSARQNAERACNANGGTKRIEVQCRSHQREFVNIDSKGRATKAAEQPPLDWWCMAITECNATRRLCESGTPGATRQ